MRAVLIMRQKKKQIQKAQSSHTPNLRRSSKYACKGFHRLDLATRSSSSFFCQRVKSEVMMVDRSLSTCLDSVRVRGTLGGVDELISQALGD